ncbi:hypothetical protein MNEG_0977, partial [Monoraphidium neglectum]
MHSQVAQRQRDNEQQAALVFDLSDAVKVKLREDANQLARLKQQMLHENEAYRKDQSVVKRIQGALLGAASWGGASADADAAGTNGSASAGPTGSSASGGAAERAAALFSALHKGGVRDWVLGRAPSAGSAEGAWQRAAAAAAAAAREDEGDGCRELVPWAGSALAHYEGPLSRSLTVQRARTAAAAEAAQLVGRALDQVLEGEREGAESPSPANSPGAARARLAIAAGQQQGQGQLAVQRRRPAPLEMSVDSFSFGQRPDDPETESPPFPAQQHDLRRSITSRMLSPSSALESVGAGVPLLAAVGHGVAAAVRLGSGRPGRAPQAADGMHASEQAAGAARGGLGGSQGPLMQSIGVRQSMSVSQLLGGDEESFQKLLSSALAGERPPSGPLLERRESAHAQQRERLVEEIPVAGPTREGAAGSGAAGGARAPTPPQQQQPPPQQQQPSPPASRRRTPASSLSPSRRTSAGMSAGGAFHGSLPQGEAILAWGSGMGSMRSSAAGAAAPPRVPHSMQPVA